jgi:hypothetical protein
MAQGHQPLGNLERFMEYKGFITFGDLRFKSETGQLEEGYYILLSGGEQISFIYQDSKLTWVNLNNLKNSTGMTDIELFGDSESKTFEKIKHKVKNYE